jgi:hypothetical protein
MTESEAATTLLGAWRRSAHRGEGLHRLFRTYTVDEAAGTVTHHRHDSLQPGDHGDLVRRYELSGDRLVLRAPNSTLEVTWERIK